MKRRNKPHFVVMAAIVAVCAAITWSCDEEKDPTLSELREDQIRYLEDSLRISDSLTRINAAGAVNYAITVVDASASSINNGPGGYGRAARTEAAVSGATVTISQFGKTQTDTTDASGVVVFTGFFRSAVNVTVRREGYTTASYISAVSISDSTGNGSINFVGNLIPLFATTGQNTATLTGRATLETDLTNKTRELVPDGTTVLAHIDASDNDFSDKFLTSSVDNIYTPACGCDLMYVGEIIQASYTAGVVGSVAGGNYTIVVPASMDGLPIELEYSELGADQTLFENDVDGQRTIVRRAVFNDNSGAGPLAALPASSSVNVAFQSFGAPAFATAVISSITGSVESISVVDGGSNYNGTPRVVITGGGGQDAEATATVTGGRITAITVTNGGTGYVFQPTVSIVSGTGAAATAGLQANGTVIGTAITNSGSGYTAAPAVTFAAPPTIPGVTGVTATGTANIDAQGRVTSITITDPGFGYIGDPTVTIAAPPAGGVQAFASAFYSGQSVNEVAVTGGSNYNYAPVVTFSAPDRANGVRATGVASIDANTREVTGIQITNAGSGYTGTPTVTLTTGSGATAQSFLAGGEVTGFDIVFEGTDYAYPPTVVIGANNSGNGSGATGTAVMSGGRVVGIQVTNPGSGYTSAPDVQLLSGTGAVAYATVTDGVITGFTVTDGGHDFAGAPRVLITGDGGGASATATVANGQITGITVVEGGSGYLDGNTPGTAVRFSATKGTAMETKPGITYVNDVYYGTGAHRE